jgi:hypothetical protein
MAMFRGHKIVVKFLTWVKINLKHLLHVFNWPVVEGWSFHMTRLYVTDNQLWWTALMSEGGESKCGSNWTWHFNGGQSVVRLIREALTCCLSIQHILYWYHNMQWNDQSHTHTHTHKGHHSHSSISQWVACFILWTQSTGGEQNSHQSPVHPNLKASGLVSAL